MKQTQTFWGVFLPFLFAMALLFGMAEINGYINAEKHAFVASEEFKRLSPEQRAEIITMGLKNKQ